MSKLIKTNNDYKAWVTEIKQHIRQSQFKAAVKVNTELIRLYWTLGKDIAERQSESAWGKGFFNELSQDLKDAFPDMEGFRLIRRAMSGVSLAICLMPVTRDPK